MSERIQNKTNIPKDRVDPKQKRRRETKLAKMVVLKNTNRMRTAVGGFNSMSYDKERLSVKDCGWGL